MDRDIEHMDDMLIDLGSVITETKGGAQSSTDSLQLRQPNGIGLADD